MLSELQQVEAKIEELKQSPYGQKAARVDTRVGWVYCWLIAIGWLTLAVTTAAIAYIVYSLALGWFTSAAAIVSLTVATYACYRGFSGLIRPRTASEIMIDELQDRVRPLSWTVDLVSSVRGRAEAKAE